MRIAISAILILSGVALISAVLAQQEPPPPEEPGVPTEPEGTAPETPTPPAGGETTPTAPVPEPETTPTPLPVTAPPTTIRPTTSAVRPIGSDELIPFTFENMQLATIIKLVSESTGRNFLIQTPIAGTVLIYCPKMIPANTALDMLGIILDSQGYTMAVTDDPPLVYVTKKAGVGPIPTKVKVEGKEEELTEKRELATLLVVLNYVSVDDMQDILRNFKSATCIMTAYPAGNFLILKDDEASLKYLLELVKKIDAPGTVSKLTFRELKYADAIETASLLTELLAEKTGARVSRPGTTLTPPTPGRPPTPTPMGVSPTIVGAATATKIMPDERTNRLIILASEKDTEWILSFVDKLDVEPTEEMYPIRTYIAQYQDATELADTLASFVAGQPRARTGQQRTARTGTVRSRTLGQTATTATGAPGAASPAAVRGPVAAGTEEAFFLADPATNMVLMQAAPQKLEMYMTLLRELDRPQKQVLIEAWVVEISSKNQLDVGVEFKSAEIGPAQRVGPMGDEVFGGSNFDLGLDSLLSGTGFPSSGLALGLRSLTNTKLDIGGKVYYLPNIDTFLRALREDTTFNILSSPKLLTLNNETASVDVTDEISIAESSITSLSTTETLPSGVTETFSRTDVGISLEITPQVNSENSVIMEIDLLVGSIAGVEDITLAGSRPVIANRSTITKVRVDNGRTIVISGLRRADRTQTSTRIPILGQIPILGLLFSHQRTLTVNTNLLIFITPHIVSDTLDMLEVTETMKNQDIETERGRFQPTRGTRKPKPLKSGQTPAWEWKK
ncbi:MAG: type II secretion system secretin GspD [bacterium]|nr:type II secretion system secretin GspD [bacterium]